jgi:hypothetical protein
MHAERNNAGEFVPFIYLEDYKDHGKSVLSTKCGCHFLFVSFSSPKRPARFWLPPSLLASGVPAAIHLNSVRKIIVQLCQLPYIASWRAQEKLYHFPKLTFGTLSALTNTWRVMVQMRAETKIGLRVTWRSFWYSNDVKLFVYTVWRQRGRVEV